MKRSLFLVTVLALSLIALEGRGQDGRSFSIQNFKPAPGHGSALTVEGASVPKGLSLSVGGMLGYQYRPLVIRECARVEGGACAEWNDVGGALVEHHLSLEILGAVAFYGVFEIGVGLPVVLYQEGEDVRVPGGPDVVESPSGHTGLSDIRLHAKLDLLRGLLGYSGELLDLSLVAVVSFPLGNAVVNGAFMGDSSVTVNPKLALGFNLDRVWLGINAGYLWRESREYYLADVEPAITYAAAADMDIANGWGAIVEFLGQTGVSFEPASSPLEGDVAARYTFENGITALAGVGVGIIGGLGTPVCRAFAGVRWTPVLETDRDGDMVLDRDDQCPDVPEDRDGFEDSDGCPDEDNDGDGILDRDDECPDEAEDADGREDEDGCPEEDVDGDGIPDAEDGCPLEPEDEDGFEDSDGCPDTDNDRDRIVDAEDRCPDEKETYNGVDDEDGCPDKGEELLKMGDARLELTQKIHFKTGSDKIVKKQSFDMLDVAAKIMSRNPSMRIRIEGHTDSKGKRQNNLDLSDRRAKSVRRYLVEKGIGEARLEAVGFGPDTPIEDNGTEQGRAANRRVEFHIIAE